MRATWIDTKWKTRCSGCNREIDEDVCWCGEMMDKIFSAPHSDNHDAVPMGCICRYGTKPPDFGEPRLVLEAGK